MVRLLSSKPSPRLAYVAQVLGLCWGQAVAVRAVDDAAGADMPTLWYDTRPPVEQAIALHPSGLLAHTGWQPGTALWRDWAGLPVLATTAHPGADPLAATFLLLTEYVLQATDWPRDAHGRPDEQHHPLVAAGLHHRALVHEYAAQLAQQLQARWPRWQPKPPQADYLLTVDIDFPWAYKHKPLWKQLGGWSRDLAHGRWPEAATRLRTWLGATDPDDPTRLWPHWPADKLRAFWLAGGTHPTDNAYTWRHPALRAQLRAAQQAGIVVGPHPSYRTADDPALLQQELQAFAQASGQSLFCSRQHYLRQGPHTLPMLAAAGVLESHSAGFAAHTGFRLGIALSHPWYDLEQEATTALWQVPFQVMDRSLQQYLQLDVDAAIAHTRSLWDTTRAHGGLFVVLLHNSILSNHYEWRGWHRWHHALQELLVNR